MLYRWLVFLHILGAFGFLLAHGGSVNATFRVRREQTLDGLRAVEDPPTIRHNGLWRAIAPKSVSQDGQVLPLILGR